MKVFTYILKNNSTDLPSKKQTNKQNSSTLHLLKEDIHGYLVFPTFIGVIFFIFIPTRKSPRFWPWSTTTRKFNCFADVTHSINVTHSLNFSFNWCVSNHQVCLKVILKSNWKQLLIWFLFDIRWNHWATQLRSNYKNGKYCHEGFYCPRFLIHQCSIIFFSTSISRSTHACHRILAFMCLTLLHAGTATSLFV